MTLEHNKTVLLFALFAAILILISAYCTERDGGVDEPGFLNPPYMLAHYGKLTFPAYPHAIFFDVPVVTHPPMHVGWIGLLWRMGMPPYYAEATPTVLLFLLAILIILFANFPAAVKLGWLFSIALLAASGETITLCFGTRPEGELLAAWLCGLLLLESGRLTNWDRRRLFAGAFLLTWAAATHYYAAPAVLGILVYMAWALRSLGGKEAKASLIALCAGGCLYGVPYLAFYVAPYYNDIVAAIKANQGPGGVALSIEKHMALYREWALYVDHPALIRRAMALGIPFWVISTALLAAVRSTRGIALAALPMQLGLFFFAWHKMPYYLLPESILFAAALAIGVLALCEFLIVRYLPAVSRFYSPAAAAVLCYCLVSGSPMLAHASISLRPRFQDTEVAQAAGRRMMGPNARIGGRWWSWYAAGAEHWVDLEHDLLLRATLIDPDTYVSNLDALHICGFDEHTLLQEWLAAGKLKMRGFFFAQSNRQLRCLQLSPQGTSPLVGYAEWNDRLYRFHEDPAGDRELRSLICPGPESAFWHNPAAGSFSIPLRLDNGPNGVQRWLVTVLAPRSSMAPAGEIGSGCREIARIPGAIAPEDRRALVEWSRTHDAPVHFYRGVDEMQGYRGVGLPPDGIAPPDAMPVANVIDLPATAAINGAKVEHTNGIRLTTIPDLGGFSATIPVRHAETVNGPCWVVVKLRVVKGRMGFGAAAEGARLLASTVGIAPSPDPQWVALKVPDFHDAKDIILFNQALGGSQADILDVSVAVKR